MIFKVLTNFFENAPRMNFGNFFWRNALLFYFELYNIFVEFFCKATESAVHLVLHYFASNSHLLETHSLNPPDVVLQSSKILFHEFLNQKLNYISSKCNEGAYDGNKVPLFFVLVLFFTGLATSSPKSWLVWVFFFDSKKLSQI